MVRAVVLVSLLSACTGGTALDTPAPSIPGGHARAEQIVIGVHNDVSGVAASRTMVFVATQDALLLYDALRAAWLPPLTREDGYPGGPATIVAADPVEDGVWVAAFGSVLYYRPHVDLLTSTLLPGVADALLFDARNPAGGAYVRSGGRWSQVTRTGAAFPVSAGQLPPPDARLVPSTLRDVYREFPALQSFAVLLTRDSRMRSWPISSGTRAPDRSEVYLGTRGNGLYWVDPVFQESRHLPYGLLEQGARALTLADHGVWVGGYGESPAGRGGVTYAAHDLQRWLWLEGPSGRPLGRIRVEALASRAEVLWVASDRGVMRLEPDRPEALRQWSLADGLPADHALSIAPTFGGVWVGTVRGLAWFDEHNARERPAEAVRSLPPNSPVRALLLLGDTLWVGSDAGLVMIAPASPDGAARRVSAAEQEPRLRRPVRAIASADTLLLVATAEEVIALDARTGEALPRVAGLEAPAVGAITSVAVDDQTIWVGGSAGVLVVSRATGAMRQLRAGRELPGEVTAVALAPGVAWMATRRGVARMTRHADGGVR